MTLRLRAEGEGVLVRGKFVADHGAMSVVKIAADLSEGQPAKTGVSPLVSSRAGAVLQRPYGGLCVNALTAGKQSLVSNRNAL